MGYIIQPSSTVADANKISFSLWFRIPVDATDFYLLQTNVASSNPGGSGFCIGGTSGNFFTPPSSYSDIFMAYESRIYHDPLVSSDASATWYWSTNSNVDYVYNTRGPFDGIPVDTTGFTLGNHANVTANLWHHFCGSIDASVVMPSGKMVLDSVLVSTRPYYQQYNGTNYFPDPSYGALNPYTQANPNFYYPIAFGDPSFALTVNQNIPINGCSVGIPGLLSSSYWCPNFHGGGGATIPIGSGSGPGQEANPNIEYSDFQLWMGQYIDWADTSNFAKVVNISGGIGRPVSPSIAASAFGQQTFLLRGDHTQFHVNLGTGGAFSQGGTINDFTPGPSFG